MKHLRQCSKQKDKELEQERETEHASCIKAHTLICSLQILNNWIFTLSEFQKVQTYKVLPKFPDMEPSTVGSPVGVDIIKNLGILKTQNAVWDLSA